MVRLLIEYANPVWLPHTCKDIERVQRRCAVNIPSRECRREVSGIILFYMIVNNFPHPTDLIFLLTCPPEVTIKDSVRSMLKEPNTAIPFSKINNRVLKWNPR